MKSTDVILAGIAGTTAFTIFSYMASRVLDKNKEEPELLGEMIDETFPGMEENESKFSGWLMHYATGIAFAAAYKGLIQTTRIKPTIKNGTIAGLYSGFPAGMIWDSSLKVLPHPPVKRNAAYYTRLCLGHAIFGAVSFLVLGLLNKDKEDERESSSPITEDSIESKISPYATAGS